MGTCSRKVYYWLRKLKHGYNCCSNGMKWNEKESTALKVLTDEFKSMTMEDSR